VAITDIVQLIIFIIVNIVKLVCLGKLSSSYLVYNISVFKLNTQMKPAFYKQWMALKIKAKSFNQLF